MFTLSMLTVDKLQQMTGGKPNISNMQSIILSLHEFGERYGLDQPHRLVHFLAQLMHESGGFRYDREVWGPTDAQKRYEGRQDLGNTQPGDGSKFRGYGPIQLTGRSNVEEFYLWCIDAGLEPPDFTQTPNLINTDPYEGLSAIWYWDKGNPTGKSLNLYADKNDIENITRRINGGLNGYSDRLHCYDRCSLSLLGFPHYSVQEFQRSVGIKADGISGPVTRSEMHKALVKMTLVENRSDGVQKSPVVDEKPVAVEPKGVDNPIPAIVTTGIAVGTPVLTSVSGLDWRVQLVLALAGVLFAGYFMYERIRMAQESKEIKLAIKEGAL